MPRIVAGVNKAHAVPAYCGNPNKPHRGPAILWDNAGATQETSIPSGDAPAKDSGWNRRCAQITGGLASTPEDDPLELDSTGSSFPLHWAPESPTIRPAGLSRRPH